MGLSFKTPFGKPGLYGDVAFTSKGEVVSARIGAGDLLVVEKDGVVQWTDDMSGYGGLMFLSLCLNDKDEAFVCGKAHDRNPAVVVIASEFDTTEVPAAGVNFPAQMATIAGEPVCFVWSDNNKIIAYHALDGAQFLIQVPDKYIGSSQGIRFVTSLGDVFYGDQTIVGQFDSIRINEWITRNLITAGQYSNDADLFGIAVITPQGKFLAFSGELAFFPRLATTPDGTRIVVSKIQDNKFSYEVYEQPFPSWPISNPNPNPTPGPIQPEKLMKLPIEVKNVRNSFIGKFPTPSKATGEEQEAYENRFRIYMTKLIQQLVFSFPNQGWGWKSSNPNSPGSKDTLTNNLNGFIGFDMFTGVGTGNPSMVLDPDSKDLTGQHFIDLPGVNWLGATVPTPTPNPDTSTLEKRVAALEAFNTSLTNVILNTVLKDGDKVTLITDNGHFVCAEGGGGGDVNATRPEGHSWETFGLKKVQ